MHTLQATKILAGLGPDELEAVFDLIEEWRDTLGDVKDIAESCDCDSTVSAALGRHFRASRELVEHGLLPTCAQLRELMDKI